MKRKKALRAFYAQLVTANAGVSPDNLRLINAFSTVKREDYLGPGPWSIFTRNSYFTTPTDHPDCLYQDILVALDSSKRINNGQPSLHAASIAALDIQRADRITHIGAGTGYYTAILRELTGRGGLVQAYEIHHLLADAAERNLAHYSNVFVHNASGITGPLPDSDAIYVCAGATHPVPAWLDALRPGGRLVFPLTSASDRGGMLLIRRLRSAQYTAKFVFPAAFIPCVGARDDSLAQRLDENFGNESYKKVKSLQRNCEPDETCWLSGNGWWLSTATAD